MVGEPSGLVMRRTYSVTDCPVWHAHTNIPYKAPDKAAHGPFPPGIANWWGVRGTPVWQQTRPISRRLPRVPNC